MVNEALLSVRSQPSAEQVAVIVAPLAEYVKSWVCAGVVPPLKPQRYTLSPSVSLGEAKANEFEVPATFYLTGGYNIKLKNPLLQVQTSAILRSDLYAWRADVTARLTYKGPKGRMYFGAGYSPTISASVFIGGDFHGVRLGYCYEIYTSGIGALQGTHEISLGYTTDLDLFKKGKNRHQSVRLL